MLPRRGPVDVGRPHGRAGASRRAGENAVAGRLGGLGRRGRSFGHVLVAFAEMVGVQGGDGGESLLGVGTGGGDDNVVAALDALMDVGEGAFGGAYLVGRGAALAPSWLWGWAGAKHIADAFR